MRILLAVNAPSSHLFPLPNGWADRGHTVDIVMDAPDGRFGHAREHAHPGMRLMTLSTGGSIVDAVSGRPTQGDRPAGQVMDVVGTAQQHLVPLCVPGNKKQR